VALRVSSCLALGAMTSHVVPVSPHAVWATATLAAGPAAVYVGGAIIATLIVVVVFPAVWSTRPSRRKAAKDVLDSILRAIGSIFRYRDR
jgi:hypothetical protein